MPLGVLGEGWRGLEEVGKYRLVLVRNMRANRAIADPRLEANEPGETCYPFQKF